ncbi:MAG: T9SS type A sorting domain-containing protein [Saprospiraceae bacterium]|nr:T9SS type A sorting domain-containing protein [Saprospiraceae bacterium]
MLRSTYLVILFFSLAFHETSLAQLPFVVSQAFPDPGDTIFYQVDELPKRISISAPGRNQFWNFGSLLGPYLQYQVIQSSSDRNDIMHFAGDQGSKNSFSEEATTLILRSANSLKVGKTEIKAQWTTNEGLPMPSADMDYQDNHEFSALFQTALPADAAPTNWKPYLANGIDSIRISILVDRKMEVDATGMLFLINGYRQESERFRVEDNLTKKIWTKKENGDWQDVTSLTRIPDLQPEQRISYHFVSLETAGNICSVLLDENGSPQQVTFVIPKEQSGYYKTAANSQWLLAYPNPALSYVRFKFLDLSPGEYTLKFYDVFMRGLFEKKYQVSGNETVEINISHLEKGPYVYSLQDKTGKKITTKRLIVIKP